MPAPSLRRSCHGFCLLLPLTALFAGPAAADNLLEAYQQAFATDPALAQARAQLQAELQGKPLARSALLPHLGVAASVGENAARITGFGTPIATSYLSNSYSVSLTQAVFNGQAFTALKQADSRIQASEAVVAYTEQQLALQVSTAYFNVLQAQAQAQVAEKQEKLLDSIYRQTDANLKVGTGDIVAVREAQARLDAAKADVIKARNAVAVAQLSLQRLTHHPVGILEDLGHFEAMGPRPDQTQPWVNMALKSQPLLHQAEAQLHTAQEQVEYNRRERWPKINLQGIASHTLGSPFPGVDFNQIGASLNLSMPIYEGGSISASVQQSQAQAQASVDHLANLRDEVTLNTQTAFLNLQDSVAQLRAAKETV
ncbi:MAG: TolC family protein, partial [Acidithiobacillus sp.]